MSIHRSSLLLLGTALLAAAPVAARTCPEQGRLNFVGLAAGGTRAVWLSSTIAGDFRLDVSETGQTIDSWQKASPGFRVTQSPVVGESSSGAHKLFGQEGPVPCDISEQLQSGQGGFLPPGINWPSARPRPPIGIALRPEHPIAVAVRPRPPIGIAVRPEQPIGIAVRPVPPVGIAVKPEQPVGIAVKPEPPVGIAVKPQPPVGIAVKPEQPVGIAVKPEPPVGIAVKPEPPVGIAVKPDPPVGIAVKPEQPVGIAVKPEQPVAVVVQPPPVPAATSSPAASATCLDPTDPSAYDQAGRAVGPLCPRLAPLTGARDLLVQTAWNAWADINHGYVRDGRSGLEGRAFLDRLSVGLDRLLLPDVAVGVSAALKVGSSRSRDELFALSSDTVEVGPYLVWRLADGLVADLAYTYASADNDVRFGPFRGGYNATRHQLAATLSGQLVFGIGYARPALTATHSWADLSGYSLHADLFGNPIDAAVAPRNFETGTVALETEVGALFARPGGGFVAPWAELGLSWAYKRPEKAGAYRLGRTEDLAGTLRAGVRFAFSPATLVDIGGGYLSLGQPGLDSWEARALVSFGF